VIDYATEDRARMLQHFHAVERRRYVREHFRALAKMAAVVAGVTAIAVAGCLYAVGYF
jgi:hypothetical protein